MTGVQTCALPILVSVLAGAGVGSQREGLPLETEANLPLADPGPAPEPARCLVGVPQDLHFLTRKREHLLPPRVQPGLAGLPGLTLSCQPTPADTWERPPRQSGWLSWVPSTVTVGPGSLLPEVVRTPAHPHFSGALSVTLRPRPWRFCHCCAARGQRTY